MQSYSDGTPCPPYYLGDPSYTNHHFAYQHQHTHNPYTTAYGGLSTMFEDQDTRNVQYTTESGAQMRKAKLRKRVSLKSVEGRNTIAIHEDHTSTLPILAEEPTETGMGMSRFSMRQSISAQPPRRRRVSAILADRLAEPEEEKRKSVLKKEARRRTIYIPDDITVDTIHPGRKTSSEDTQRSMRRQLSPDMGFDLVTLSEGPSPHPVLKHRQDGIKKMPRKSLAMPPKRAPLGNSKRALQSVSFAEDILGAPTGKENRAPQLASKAAPVKVMDDMTRTRLSMAGLKCATPDKVDQRLKASMAQVTSPAKRKGTDSILDYSPNPTRVKTSKAAARASAVVHSVLKDSNYERPACNSEDEFAEPAARPHAHQTSKRSEHVATSQYQVLAEDLAHPSLYEEHWLEHQEISLSQLLNDILEPHQLYTAVPDPKNLRKELLSLYHDPQIPSLHKRLQASLLYGALSIPKDLLAKASRVRDDLGLKRKFLDLFLDTYELKPLRAAVEVIIAREVPQARLSGAGRVAIAASHNQNGSASSIENGRDRLSTGSNLSASERKARAERKSLERFLEAFFIRHEDAARPRGTIATSIARIVKSTDNKIDDFGSPAWSWRRTVLRSLMLILLLDRAKASGAVQARLFQTTSPHKSSSAILTGLSVLLLPSLGDVIRPLSHLSYTLQSQQNPLQEYLYHVENLATDLRDGVKLTRLVELMLFKTANMKENNQHFRENTITLTLPAGEAIKSTWIHNPAAEWILSQHLKVPCIGRPQKIYNVQIALSALSALGGAAGKAAVEITAEDIVDGHRERTLSLLWAVVGYCGLGTLVDWKELKREIRHFRLMARKAEMQEDITDGLFATASSTVSEAKDAAEAVEKTPSLKRCTKLLLAWAQSIAALNKLQVTNLTTLFSNPKVFEVLVEVYLPFFPASSSETSLAGKLKAIGCSQAFTDLFASPANSPSIPSKSFTVSTLAFLASRLLPLSRTHRAATMLQRAWRHFSMKRDIGRRVALARLAHHCAVVVGTRERVVGAAVVLQRAWRAVGERRLERLVRDVGALQASCRGWLVRERLRGGGRVRERRIVGGW